MSENKPKTCFVISPIGEEGSDIRHNADEVLNGILKPLLKELGIQPVRSDEISDPGIITNQIMSAIKDSDIVIADLTGSNPNVFYELAFCHTIGKPSVLIGTKGTRPPFDISAIRIFEYDLSSPIAINELKEQLKGAIQELGKESRRMDNPISAAEINYEQLKQTTGSRDIGDHLRMLYELLFNLGNRLISIENGVDLMRYHLRPKSALGLGQLASSGSLGSLSQATPRMGTIDGPHTRLGHIGPDSNSDNLDERDCEPPIQSVPG